MFDQRKVCAALALCAAMALPAANAAEQQSGFYVGLRGGQATADLDQDELDLVAEDAFFFAGAPVLDGESSLEDSDTTWSLFAGYRFNDYFALEAGYTNLGTSEYRAEGLIDVPGPGFAEANMGIDFEATGISAGLIAGVPLGETFDLHGSLGLLFSKTEITVMGGSGGFDASDSVSGNDQDVFYGAGLGWRVGKSVSLSVDYHLYKDVGSEDDTGETDINSVTLGAAFYF
jgi:OmpA-OmpF porin, OOP family